MSVSAFLDIAHSLPQSFAVRERGESTKPDNSFGFCAADWRGYMGSVESYKEVTYT